MPALWQDRQGAATAGGTNRLLAAAECFFAELSGIKAMSRADVQSLCASVLGMPIAISTIQKILDRASAALNPAYAKMAGAARGAEINYANETCWFKEHDLKWLWAMVNDQVALYRIDDHRSKQGFQDLVQYWNGILVSDGYGIYKRRVNARQTCLAHLVHDADALAQRDQIDIKCFGHL